MFGLIDQCIIKFDKTLKTLLPVWPSEAVVKNPAEEVSEIVLSKAERHQAAGMMRVNLAGEVAAQGLYRGQLLVARDAKLQKELQQACIMNLIIMFGV